MPAAVRRPLTRNVRVRLIGPLAGRGRRSGLEALRLGREVCRLRREREAGPGFLDGPHEHEEDFFLGREERGPVARKEVREDLDVERVGVQLGEAHARRRGLDARVGGETLAAAVEDGLHLGGRGLETQAECVPEKELVATAEVLDLGRHHRPVRDRNDRPLEGADSCRVEGDVLDLALNGPDLHDVADAQDLVREDDDPAEKVLEALLGREGDRDAADPEARERRGEVDTEDSERGDDGPDDDESLQDAAADRERGGRAGPEARRRIVAREVRTPTSRTKSHPTAKTT